MLPSVSRVTVSAPPVPITVLIADTLTATAEASMVRVSVMPEVPSTVPTCEMAIAPPVSMVTVSVVCWRPGWWRCRTR